MRTFGVTLDSGRLVKAVPPDIELWMAGLGRASQNPCDVVSQKGPIFTSSIIDINTAIESVWGARQMVVL